MTRTKEETDPQLKNKKKAVLNALAKGNIHWPLDKKTHFFDTNNNSTDDLQLQNCTTINVKNRPHTPLVSNQDKPHETNTYGNPFYKKARFDLNATVNKNTFLQKIPNLHGKKPQNPTAKKFKENYTITLDLTKHKQFKDTITTIPLKKENNVLNILKIEPKKTKKPDNRSNKDTGNGRDGGGKSDNNNTWSTKSKLLIGVSVLGAALVLFVVRNMKKKKARN